MIYKIFAVTSTILLILLAIYIGIIILPHPETNTITVEQNSQYLGYGVIQENDTVIGLTKKDNNKSVFHAYYCCLIAPTIIVGYICLLYHINQTLVIKWYIRKIKKNNR